MKPSIIFVIIVMLIIGYWLYPKQEESVWVDHGKEPVELIRIEIIGAVDFPGIYHVFEQLTVSEALVYGGKLASDADLSGLQLSEVITRDRQIIIPRLHDETPEIKVKVNVNQASFKELITVPGMTESRAASLIIYRETHGDFKSLDELILVKYIGVATLEKIRPYLTL